MFGLMILLFLALYFLISLAVISFSYRLSESFWHRGRAGGVVAFVLMYSLVFWDWIPVLVTHKYFCETEAGFWVYQKPEQWIKANPNDVGKKWGDWSIPTEIVNSQINRYWLGPHIYVEVKRQPDFLYLLRREEQQLVDSRSKKIIARVIQFNKINESAMSVGGGNLTDFKFWLALNGNVCLAPDGVDYNIRFKKYSDKLMALGQGENKKARQNAK